MCSLQRFTTIESSCCSFRTWFIFLFGTIFVTALLAGKLGNLEDPKRQRTQPMKPIATRKQDLRKKKKESHRESFKRSKPQESMAVATKAQMKFLSFRPFLHTRGRLIFKEKPGGVHANENEWRRKKKERRGFWIQILMSEQFFSRVFAPFYILFYRII